MDYRNSDKALLKKKRRKKRSLSTKAWPSRLCVLPSTGRLSICLIYLPTDPRTWLARPSVSPSVRDCLAASYLLKTATVTHICVPACPQTDRLVARLSVRPSIRLLFERRKVDCFVNGLPAHQATARTLPSVRPTDRPAGRLSIKDCDPYLCVTEYTCRPSACPTDRPAGRLSTKDCDPYRCVTERVRLTQSCSSVRRLAYCVCLL